MRETLNDFIRKILTSDEFKKNFDEAHKGGPSLYEYYMEKCKYLIGNTFVNYTIQESVQTSRNIESIEERIKSDL